MKAFLAAVRSFAPGSPRSEERPTATGFVPGLHSLWLVLLAAIAVGALFAAPAYAAEPHEYLPGRHLDGLNTGSGSFANADGTVVDSEGDIYVSDYTHNVIDVFGPAGNYLTGISTPHPVSLAVDSQGNLYTVKYNEEEVVMFTPNNYPFVGTPSYTGPTVIDGSESAFSVAVDPSNDHLWVSLYWSSEGIVEYKSAEESTGGVPEEIGNPPGAAGASISAPAIDIYGANHDIYVSLEAPSRVQIFDGTTGALKQTITGPNPPGELFGSFSEAGSLAVDQSNGDVYVGDIATHRVVDQFTSAGVFVSKIGPKFGVAEELEFDNGEPSDVAIDPATGDIFVTSTFDVYAFGPIEFDLTLNTSGGGGTGTVNCEVDGSPAIDEPCETSYPEGTHLKLIPAPDSSSAFVNWTGDCTGSGDCELTMGADHSVGAIFDLIPGPTVGSVTPNEGPIAGGQVVTITGTHLTGAEEVKFGSTAVICTEVVTTCKVESSEEIKATTPTHTAGTVDVTVTTPGGTSPTTSADHYTYRDLPTLISCTPNEGKLAAGESVTCTGTGFVTGATVFNFGPSNPATSVSVNGTGTSATMSAPTHAAGQVSVTATTAGGTSGGTPYNYRDLPTLISCTPNEGKLAAGESVTCTGTGFVTGATVFNFGPSNPATSVSVNGTGTSATMSAPTHAAGQVSVTATTAGGTSGGTPYIYRAAPTVTALSPNKGPTAGGQVVTITGANLTAAKEVKFGTTAIACPSASCTLNSASQIKVTDPGGSAGTVDVTVITAGGTSATGAADKYTYVAPLALTVSKAGTGSGTVTCNGGACAATYAFGTKVTLAASAASGSTFAGFSGGGCSGTGPCAVTMSADTTVTATFTADSPPGGGGGGGSTTCPADPSKCPPPSNEVKAGTAKQQGTVIALKVIVPGPGAVSASGKNLITAKGTAKAAGTLTLKLKLTSAGKKQLQKKGKLKIKVKIVFTPTGGTAGSAIKTVTFKSKATH